MIGQPTHNVHMQLASMCEQAACGNYEKAKGIFELSLARDDDLSTKILIEAFAIMLLRIEVREFERDRLLAEISKAREELEIHQAHLAVENSRLRANFHDSLKRNQTMIPVPAQYDSTGTTLPNRLQRFPLPGLRRDLRQSSLRALPGAPNRKSRSIKVRLFLIIKKQVQAAKSGRPFSGSLS